jgi:hypothetical protein
MKENTTMKRFLLIALGLAMILTAVACNTKKEEAASTEPTGEPTKEPTQEPTEAPTEKPEEPLTETTLNVAEHTSDVFRQLGRTYVKDNVLNIDFACGGIEFAAECEGDVKVQINSARDTRFTIFVDGVRSNLRPQVTPSNSGYYITIASKLARGEHTFRIISQTQFIWSYGSIGNVQIKGNFLPKPLDRELYLEFYGDSILNGSNVFCTGGGINASDATQAFGFVTAEMMNADMALIGCSSIGLTKNSRSFVMKDIWNYAGARYSAFSTSASEHLLPGIPEWDFARVPSAIIIEQGVNDGSNASQQIFEDAVKEMVNNLRSKYGKDVPIVFPVGYSKPSLAYNTALPRIVEKLGGENANLYVCKLSDAATGVPGGDGTHPGVESTKKMAEELSAFLKTIIK